MRERVTQLIDLLYDGQIVKFAESIGVKQSTFSTALHKDAFSRKILENILAEYPKISRTWLYTGVGEMFDRDDYDVNKREKVVGPRDPQGTNDKIVELEKKIVRLEAQNEILREQNSQLLSALQGAAPNKGVINAKDVSIKND